jgi:hypothetical protein
MWREVTLSITVEVMADEVEEATYQAFLKLPDLVGLGNIEDWTATVHPEVEAAQ